MTDEPQVSTAIVNDATVVAAEGEIDKSTVGPWAREVRAVCRAAHSPALVVLDLTGVTFMGTVGLQVLVSAQRRCARRGVTLRLAAAELPVVRALRALKLHDRFTIAGTVIEATLPVIVWDTAARETFSLAAAAKPAG